MAKGNRPAGGIGSRVVTTKPIRFGESAREIRPKGVSQIGSSMGNHATDRGRTFKGAIEPVRGNLKPPGSPGTVPLGNEVATNVGRGGPGTGRTVYATGGQGMHGRPDPGQPRPAGELFPGWPSKQ